MGDIDWKDLLKKLGVLGGVLAILVWLFSPTDERHNRK